MDNEKTKANFNLMMTVMSIVLCCFLLTGIILTFVLKSRQSALENQLKDNTQLEQEYSQKKEQSDYLSSDEYKDDYYQNEQNYGHDGDKIIEVQ